MESSSECYFFLECKDLGFLLPGSFLLCRRRLCSRPLSSSDAVSEIRLVTIERELTQVTADRAFKPRDTP